MKKITQETERKLMTVIEKTAEFVGAGMSPNDAIVKAAANGDLRPGEIGLVVHAYNTGRTTRQREMGDNPFEKAAEFELADTGQILERIYPSQVKTASAQSNSTVISPEYSYSPTPMLQRKQNWEKRAQHVDWRTINGKPIETPEQYPTDPAQRVKVAMANIDRLRKSAEESRRVAADAFDQLGRTFTDLTTYFRRPDALPMPVVKEAVILLHGDKGEQLMDQLVRVTPALSKLANHQVGKSLLGVTKRAQFGTSVDELDCMAQPFDMVAKIMQQIDDYKEKKAAHQQMVATFDKEAGESILPFVSPAVSGSILGPSSDSEKSAFDFTSPLKTLGTYSLVQRTMGPIASKLKGDGDEDPYQTKAVNKTVNALNDPSHENKLREINTQAMLQDLMLNDPVISGYDPHEVTGAFNDISQISPSVSDQKMLMQSLLRKRLQQGTLDTFDQDQLLGFESKLRQQQQPMGRADGSIL